MKKQFLLLLFVITNIWINIYAQIEGDNIFANDQIITIELNFDQENFWDSLTLNYETSTYMAADLILTDETGTYEFADVAVRLKGNSSYSHPGNKKSFKIDFNRIVSGQNYDGLKKLNFSNGFKDPTLIREKVFFDVCRAADVAAPRANFANVYFNDELLGFYTVIEQIDDQFLDWRILDDDGNLFKAGDNFSEGPGGGDGEEADLKYYGPDQADYEELYELKSNENENDWTDLIEFIDFINNSSPEVFESELENHIELEEYLRSAALDNLFSNLDSYTGSARNYYIYHNLTTDKWEWIKWDGNESFGTYRGGPGLNDLTSLAIDYHSDNRPLLGNIYNSDLLFARYKNEMCGLLDDFFITGYVDDKIDALKTLIEYSVYADVNKMYSDADFENNITNDISLGGGPMGGTIYGLKSFIEQRDAFVTAELNCSVFSHDYFNSKKIISYPNPFHSVVTIDWNHNQFHQLSIYNSLGMKLYQENVEGKSTTEIDLSFLGKGAYVVDLSTLDKNVENTSIVKLIKL